MAIGLVLAVALFMPVAAVRYRRTGRLAPRDLVLLVAGAVYGVAVWTFTLLPLPSESVYTCEPLQRRPLAFLDDLAAARSLSSATGGSPVSLLLGTTFLQVELNVVLFVPLGMLVRFMAHRGVVAATLTGLATSLLIEATQATGVWGVYPCAYRIADVDDVLTNAAGALLGAVLSYPYVVRRRRRPAAAPREPGVVTLGRRWTGMACDLFFIAVSGAGSVVVWRSWEQLTGSAQPLDISLADTGLMWGVPFLVEAVLVLGAGRTVGELVVDLRTTPAAPWRRLVKLATGVTPLLALLVLGLPLVALAFGALTLALSVSTPDRRGLSNTLAGLALGGAPGRSQRLGAEVGEARTAGQRQPEVEVGQQRAEHVAHPVLPGETRARRPTVGRPARPSHRGRPP